jgi:hypothetical protein
LSIVSIINIQVSSLVSNKYFTFKVKKLFFQHIDQLNWTLIAALGMVVLITVSQVYLIYVVMACYRYLKRLRIVVATEQLWKVGSWTDDLMSRIGSSISRPPTVKPPEG